MEKPTVRISVRNLVEFILRSGDLDNRRGTKDTEAMQIGSKLHRKIQRSRGGNYEAEVVLRRVSEFDDVDIVVEGRADGIFSEDDRVCIEEIKGTYQRIEEMAEPVMVHEAQAKCYAFIHGELKALESIDIQMTYIHMETEKIRLFENTYELSALRTWFEGVMEQYHKWISFDLKWKESRNASTNGLEFPFEYREGQKKMVGSVYHTIASQRQIFMQAPTGVGKTMSAVFPAVRAVGEKKAEKVFYLTAKTITRTVAAEAFEILIDRGLKYKVITLTAKEKMCMCEKVECNPKNCPYAKGHFDRINDAVYELWTQKDRYDRETLLEHAQKWMVCPFEMSLDVALWCDAIICDYNYVFDPNVHLKRFFNDNRQGEYIFLIDEAHNLVERGREMYSAILCKEDLMAAKNEIKEYSKSLTRAFDRVNRHMLELKKTTEKYAILDTPGNLPISVLQLQGEMDKFFEEISEDTSEEIISDAYRDCYFQVRNFLNICELLDENYVIYTENCEDGKFRVKLFCVNPARNLSDYLNKGVSTSFFSATMLPMLYYRKLLSVREDDYGIYVKSPFEQSKRSILVGTDVSSRYTRRNYGEYRRIAEYIARSAIQKKGNYMVFFPSYKMMDAVYEIYENEFALPWAQTLCQKPSMNEKEREEFLNAFDDRDGTLIGFCILGGVFSEGIDLTGESLIGAIIVGTGIPQIGTEREILKKYYDEKGENGFDYAYRFPGMNKVLQAAGRVIRTTEDEGVILLLDDRFRNREYEEMFPMEWSDRSYCHLGSLELQLQKFWNRSK